MRFQKSEGFRWWLLNITTATWKLNQYKKITKNNINRGWEDITYKTTLAGFIMKKDFFQKMFANTQWLQHLDYTQFCNMPTEL